MDMDEWMDGWMVSIHHSLTHSFSNSFSIFLHILSACNKLSLYGKHP